MSDSLRLYDTLTSAQPTWTPACRITEAEFFAMPVTEIRTLFLGATDFVRELVSDGAVVMQQEGA